MPQFERYIGIDYSGAETPDSSCKGLLVYVAVPTRTPETRPAPTQSRRYWTRRGLAEWLCDELGADEELKKLYAASSDRHRLIWRCFRELGLRDEELAFAFWSDIDLDGEHVASSLQDRWQLPVESRPGVEVQEFRRA